MKKPKYQENPKSKKEYEKINIRKILDKKENMKKNKYADNLQRQRKYEKKKTNMRKILNLKGNMKKYIRGKP